MGPKVAICFLVINKMKELPEIAITSAHQRSGAEIFLGFLDESDLPSLQDNIITNRVLLENHFSFGGANHDRVYKDFAQDSFYQIVQLKWQLLQKVFEMGYDYVIYSDTDVYWNQDPCKELIELFEKRCDVHVQIQSFTDQASRPKLCMGFVAFRNSQQSKDFISDCRARHTKYSREIGRIGDDDIVTQYYEEKDFPELILELPQTTFPVGRMLKIFSKNSKFPGLPSPVPYIFHANYVVGLRNKTILMKIFMTHYSLYDRKVGLGARLNTVLFFQRIRFLLSRWKTILIK
jgi:hypothetical protein